MQPDKSFEALQSVLEICKTAAELARRVQPLVAPKGLKCSQSHVYNWVTRNRCVPPDYVIAVSQAVDWRVTPHSIRSDIYPHDSDGLPADDPRRHGGQLQRAA